VLFRSIPLVSFDNLDTSAYFDPPLSSVNQPIDELAEKSLDTLLMILNKKTPERLQTLATTLMPRNSCGCVEENLQDLYEQTTKDHIQLRARFSTLRNYYKTMDTNIMMWRSFSQEMNSVMDYSQLISTLEPHLLNMGIHQFYLCIYQWVINYPDLYIPKYSNLIMAIDDDKTIVNEKKTVTFITEKLLPDGIIHENKQFILSVHPLVKMGTHYGYIIFGLTDLEAMVYGVVREQICNTIHTIHMMKERNDTLEKLKSTLDDLQAKEVRLREMVTNLPSILMETDTEFRITYLNNAGCEVFSLARDNLPENLSLPDYIHESDRSRFEEYCRNALTGTPSRLMEFRIINEKKIIEMICMVMAIVRDNKPAGIRLSAINLNSLLKLDNTLEDSVIDKYHLSGREKEVLKYLIIGEKYKNIGEKLFIAESTVKDHVKSIFSKMGVENKKEFYFQFRNFLNKNNEHESLVFLLLKFFLNE
jgi:PAS domain S-box-containing protein